MYIQKTPSLCANIVNASQFDIDAAAGKLPNYVFYIPNLKNDGHDTGVAFADAWYARKFSKYVADSKFMQRTILISTFDESGRGAVNKTYTSIVGPAVKSISVSETTNHYNLLRMIEDNWQLGNLGKNDFVAKPLNSIWK